MIAAVAESITLYNLIVRTISFVVQHTEIYFLKRGFDGLRMVLEELGG